MLAKNCPQCGKPLKSIYRVVEHVHQGRGTAKTVHRLRVCMRCLLAVRLQRLPGARAVGLKPTEPLDGVRT